MPKREQRPFLPPGGLLLFAAILLLAACPSDRIIAEQQERTKVSIATQNEQIRKLEADVVAAEKALEVARNMIIFCWDEKVVDLANKRVCKVAAGGFFVPESENGGQLSGSYTVPAGLPPNDAYCDTAKVSVASDRYAGMSRHFSQGCRLVWAEQDRRRRIAQDKSDPGMRHAAPVNDVTVQ